MKLLTAVAVIALTTATAAYAQSGNSAPTNLAPSNQSQQAQTGAKAKSTARHTAAAKVSRTQQDQKENQITEQLNRQQAQMAANMGNGGTPPQTAAKPDQMPMSSPPPTSPQ